MASGQRAREDEHVLRLVLRVHPSELARLPWEFLFDPRQQDYLGLTLPLVRSPHALAPRQRLRVPAPPVKCHPLPDSRLVSEPHATQSRETNGSWRAD
jgi:hypothetical protein